MKYKRETAIDKLRKHIEKDTPGKIYKTRSLWRNPFNFSTTRQTVYNSLKQLEKEGLIELDIKNSRWKKV